MAKDDDFEIDEIEDDDLEDDEIDDDLDGDDLDDLPIDDDDADDDDVSDDDDDEEESDEALPEEEDEDEELEDESLDVLLVRDQGLDRDELTRGEPREGLGVTVPPGAGEFTCRSCFLVKRRAQLADEKRMICFDCA